MSERRVVRLLSREELTPQQRAIRKYQKSPKGKAMLARARAKRRSDPVKLAKDRAATRDWRERHRLQVRVYERIYKRRRRREARCSA